MMQEAEESLLVQSGGSGSKGRWLSLSSALKMACPITKSAMAVGETDKFDFYL